MGEVRRVPFKRSVPALPEIDERSSPIESFAAASPETLEALMLSRMNTAANLRKDIGMLIVELAEQIADAKLAELLLARKRRKPAPARMADTDTET